MPQLVSIALRSVAESQDFTPLINLKNDNMKTLLQQIFFNVNFLVSQRCARPLCEKAEELKQHAIVVNNLYRLRSKDIPASSFPSLLRSLVVCCQYYRDEKIDNSLVKDLSIASNFFLQACTSFFHGCIRNESDASNSIFAIKTRLTNKQRTVCDMEICLNLLSYVCERQMRMRKFIYEHLHGVVYNVIFRVAGPDKPVENLNFFHKTVLGYSLRIFATLCNCKFAVEYHQWQKIEVAFYAATKILSSSPPLTVANDPNSIFARTALDTIHIITKIANQFLPEDKRNKFFSGLFNVLLIFLVKNNTNSKLHSLFNTCFKIFFVDMPGIQDSSIWNHLPRFFIAGVLPLLRIENLDKETNILACSLIKHYGKLSEALPVALAKHIVDAAKQTANIHASVESVVFPLRFIDFFVNAFPKHEEMSAHVSDFLNSPEFSFFLRSNDDKIVSAAICAASFELRNRQPNVDLIRAVISVGSSAGKRTLAECFSFIARLCKYPGFWSTVHANINSISNHICAFIRKMEDEECPDIVEFFSDISALSEFYPDFVGQLPLILTTMAKFLQRLKQEEDDNGWEITPRMIELCWSMFKIIKNTLIYVCDDETYNFQHLKLLGDFLVAAANQGIHDNIYTVYQILNSFFLIETKESYASLKSIVLRKFLEVSHHDRLPLIFPSFVLYFENPENIHIKAEYTVLFLDIIRDAIEHDTNANLPHDHYSGYYELSWVLDQSVEESEELYECIHAFLICNIKNKQIAERNSNIGGFAPGQCVVLASLINSAYAHLLYDFLGADTLRFFNAWLKSAPLHLNSRALVDTTLTALAVLMHEYHDDVSMQRMLSENGRALIEHFKDASTETFPDDNLVNDDDEEDDLCEYPIDVLPCEVISDDKDLEPNSFDETSENVCEHAYFGLWQIRQEEHGDFHGVQLFYDAS